MDNQSPTPSYKKRSDQRSVILFHLIFNDSISRKYAEEKLITKSLAPRIFELKQQGYLISTTLDENRMAIYHFHGHRDDKEKSKSKDFETKKKAQIKNQIKWHLNQCKNLKLQLKYYEEKAS